jgi:hypothetical protein
MAETDEIARTVRAALEADKAFQVALDTAGVGRWDAGATKLASVKPAYEAKVAADRAMNDAFVASRAATPTAPTAA